ncbi:ATP-binding cassette domain-containing protein [Candidatus Mycoplasma pogonae]
MKKKNKKVLLDVQNLKKIFYSKKTTTTAVNDINFKIHEGEILGLIGESGSGKTTVGRTLIRLYEEYGGFVTVDGKVISGKKLSKKHERFLRKNVQMIFQDPHASLNPQKNVFYSLKEPLVANKILKDEIKNVYLDLFAIQKNFKYTFLEEFYKTEYNILKYKNDVALKFLGEWEERFKKINFSNFKKHEDIFQSYFSYFEKKYNSQSSLIPFLYKQIENLFNVFYEAQNKYRLRNLDFDERILLEAKEKLLEFKKISKISKEKYDLLNKIKEQKKVLKNLKSEIKDKKNNSKNLLQAFAYQFYLEYKHNKNYSNLISNPNVFKHYKTLSLIKFLSMKKIIPSYSLNRFYILPENTNLIWLENNDINELFNFIKNYNINFLENFKFNYSNKKFLKTLKEKVYTEYKLDISDFLQKAANNKNTAINEFDFEKRKLKKLKNTLKTKKYIVKFDEKKLNQLQKNVEEAQKIHEIELEKYYDNFKEKEKIIKSNILNEEKRYQKEVLELQKRIDEIGKQKHLEFKKKLLEKLNSQNLNKKEINETINYYEMQYKKMLDNLAAFNNEVKLINKEIYNLKFLLGINNNEWTKNRFFAKKIIKEILLKQKVYKALEDVGLLKQFAYRYPHEFSGGQRQRIVIARALITNPKLIIADEPIASLDISIQAQIVNLLKELCEKRNIGMLFIAHDLSMVEYITDNILIMHLGNIVERGSTNKIYQNPKHPYTISLFDSIPKMSNADIPFENIAVDLSYLQKQAFPAKVEYFEIDKDHYIFGTEEQYKEWRKN